MINKHLLHKRTSIASKLPTISDIEYGEIAINYSENTETISIRNSNDKIITFQTTKQADDRYVNVSGDTMNGALNIQSTLNIGSGNTVTGKYAFAQGGGCTASGDFSHAEGYETTANDLTSHAEGFRTIASGQCSHAEGNITIANGNFSHAEGNITIASGQCSHAEGSGTIANGYSSHAEGYETIANNLAEHASGAYNNSISGTNQDITALTADTKATLFSIGNGDGGANKRNAFELKWNGDAYFSGDTKFAKGVTANTFNAITSIYSPNISATTIDTTTINASGGLKGDLNGNASTASKLQTPRTISLAGDVTGSVSFDGSSNVTITNLIQPLYAASPSKGGSATSANKVNSAISLVAGTFAPKSFDGSSAVSVNVPTHTSHLTNDSDFTTNASNIYLSGVTGSANGTMTFARKGDASLTFNSTHIHPISEITNLQTTLNSKVDNSTYDAYTAATNTALNGKQAVGDYATNTTVTNGLATKANTVHTHTIAQVDYLQGALDGKQAVGDYATNTALNNGLAGKANTVHTHTIAQVDGLQGSLDSKQATGDYATRTELANGLAGKSDTSHTHGGYVLKAGDTMTGNLIVQGTISATSQIYSSDIVLKENIDIITDENVDKISKIATKQYNFIEDEEKRQKYGVIAQDLEVSFPELVYADKESGIKGVDYISFLILKCEQLQRDLNTLQSKFDNLNK